MATYDDRARVIEGVSYFSPGSTIWIELPATAPVDGWLTPDPDFQGRLTPEQQLALDGTLRLIEQVTTLKFRLWDTASILTRPRYPDMRIWNSANLPKLPGSETRAAGQVASVNALEAGIAVKSIRDVRIDMSNVQAAPGSYGAYVLAHELGHALGLVHPTDPVGSQPVDAHPELTQ